MTTHPTCPRCARPTGSPVATVCRVCLAELGTALHDAPAWAEQLELTVGRQGVAGDPVRRSSATAPLPFDADASLVLERLCWTVIARAGWHSRQDDQAPSSFRRACAWLRARLERVEVSDDGPLTVSSIVAVLEAAQRACDPRRPELLYLGPCDVELEHGPCGVPLTALPGASWASCAGCGATYDVPRRRAELLRAAEDVLAPAADLARALTRLSAPVTPERIRTWQTRGRLAVKGREPVRGRTGTGAPLYRVGDVLDLLAQDARRNGRAA